MTIQFYTHNYFQGRHSVILEAQRGCVFMTYWSEEFDEYKFDVLETLGM